MTPKQMLSHFPILLLQVNLGNNSKTLKNEIWQILDSLYRSNNITKKVYDRLINV